MQPAGCAVVHGASVPGFHLVAPFSNGRHSMPRKRTGFSLTELLVVILIVAILGGLLTVAVQRARAQARSTQCLNNLRQLALGFRLYADARGGKLPDGKREPWFVQIAPLLEAQQSVFRCPADPQEVDLSYGWRDESATLPTASLAGKKIEHVANSELVLVFDQATGWHAPEMLNAAMVNSATLSLSEDEFEHNLLLDSGGGKLFNWDLP
jgi:prepilin-type N-terminal cleavage/methylation domain-containing protein